MDQEAIEKVLLTGDLAQLTVDQRLAYYKSVCESLGLNPLTQPFGYISFEGRVQLYARKDATEQLRKRHNVSITELRPESKDGVYMVTVKAQDGNGRTDMATGAVATTYVTDSGTVKSYMGVGLANAIMKAETKAKRRVTLSICGLGLLDESEIEDMDQRPTDERTTTEITKRNVEQATANATAETTPAPTPKAQLLANTEGLTTAAQIPDLGDTVVHIGKAEGNMLGRKVRELPDPIINWLHDKWRDKLNPISATDQDIRLKKAVEAEAIKRRAAPTAAQDAPTGNGNGQDTTPPPNGATRTAMLDDLRGKIEEMVMTPDQFMGYLQLAGFSTTEKHITGLTDEQLAYLLNDWETAKKSIEVHVKPTEKEAPPKKGRRKK